MTVEELNVVLLLAAAVLLTAIVAVRLSYRLGVPSLLAYLGLGLAIGEQGLGIQFENAQLAQALGLGALVLILAEGGLTTSWSQVRSVMPLATVLATFGVVVSATITAAAAHFLLDADWRFAFLLGSVVSSTDAAAVFSVLRNLRLPPRLASALEAESGLNDPTAVILVTLLAATGTAVAPLSIVGEVLYQLVVGAAIGAAIGPLGAYALRRVALPASGLYPIAVLTLTVGAYAGAALLGASGFLAVYVAAIILGNSRLPHGPATRSFAEGVGWLAQIGLFVMLGLLASPSRLPREVIAALVVGFALLLVARPVSVALSATPFRLPWREQAFLSWAGLRGAVPIVLATVPASAGVTGSERLFDLVFVLVIIFTLVQGGPTLPWVARGLRVTAPGEARDIDVESAPLEELGAELLQLQIPDDSLLNGVEIFELRLPRGASVTLLVRDERSFVPTERDVLVRGDQMLVVTTREARDATERRLRAVSRRGKLARWYGERGNGPGGGVSDRARWWRSAVDHLRALPARGRGRARGR